MPVFPAEVEEPGAPGGLIETDFQYQFRDLVFGAGTDFVTTEVTGLLGSAPTRDTDINKENDHGVHLGQILYGKRIIAMNVSIRGDHGIDIEEKLDVARRVFQLPRKRLAKVPEPLVFRRPGFPDFVSYVRCTKRDFPSNYKTARGLAVGSVEFQAGDPLIYSLQPGYAALNLPLGVLQNTILVTQIGTHNDGTPPTLVIEGPAEDPIIQNETDENRAIRLDVAIGINDAVRINMQTRTVEYRTGIGGPWVEDYTIVRNDNQWWNLLPGPNTIRYQRSGAAAAASTLEIYWQNAWS